eukprot:m.55382 g.55382  ORF g.55382 m.55382 type:complete len:760 (+) comp10981_c0_seq3:158-2437(+)
MGFRKLRRGTLLFFIIGCLVSEKVINTQKTQHDNAFVNQDGERPKHFVNKWAVHVVGGVGVADIVAKKQGFLNLGQVGTMKDHYHFKLKCDDLEPDCVPKYNHSHHHTARLHSHQNVKWAEQQLKLNRRRRMPSIIPPAGYKFASPEEEAYYRDLETQKSEVQVNVSRRDFAASIRDPYYSAQWHMHNGGKDINVIPAWEKGYTGEGVVVTIVDDGMDYSHPDLKENYDSEASTDLNGHDSDPMPNVNDPINKHGTRCSGEIGAAKNDICTIGIAYKSSIGAVRMLDGDVTDSVEAGSLSLNPSHIDIYTNSWGPNDDGRTIEGPARLAKKAFEDGIKIGRNGKGSIYIFASGNGGSRDDCNGDGYANAVYTIAIGAIDSQDKKPYYSENCAACMAVTYSSGSGPSIATTDLHHGCTKSHSGTSAAAPIGAGILALVLQANSELTWRDVQHLIVRTCTQNSPTDSGWYKNKAGYSHHHHFGFGSMNTEALVNLAETWKNVPPVIIEEFSGGEGQFSGMNPCSLTVHVQDTRITSLEHVQVYVNIDIGAVKRGDVLIEVTCPSGTPSSLLSSRSDSGRSRIDWTMMTVRCWGEDPKGQYTLKISSASRYSGSGTLHNWKLILHGTNENDDSPQEQMRTETKDQETVQTTTAGSVLSSLSRTMANKDVVTGAVMGGIATLVILVILYFVVQRFSGPSDGGRVALYSNFQNEMFTDDVEDYDSVENISKVNIQDIDDDEEEEFVVERSVIEKLKNAAEPESN